MLQDFNAQFKQITDNLPLLWQEALYERFIAGGTDNIPATCVLPTGLGKTSIIAIWLLALALIATSSTPPNP